MREREKEEEEKEEAIRCLEGQNACQQFDGPSQEDEGGWEDAASTDPVRIPGFKMAANSSPRNHPVARVTELASATLGF